MGGIALVTGANGLVGSHVADVLRERGSRLRLMVRHGGDHSFIETFRPEFVYGDLGDHAALGKAVEGVDVVFHVAGITSASRDADFFRVNAEGTRALIDACKRAANPPRRFVYVSSLAAVGPSADGRPLAEDDPCRPINAYGRSKREGEVRAREAAGAFAVTIARPPAVYGPRDRDILVFFRCIRRGLLPLLGPADQELCLIHARDLAEGLAALAEEPRAAGGTYFLTGPPIGLLGFAGAISKALGVRFRTVPVPRVVRRAIGVLGEWGGRISGRPWLATRDRFAMLEQRAWVCSGERAARDAGFRPRISVEEGVARTVEWYRAAGWL